MLKRYILPLRPFQKVVVADFADLVRLARVIEDALGGRRLAGVNMRHDTEIAVVFDLVFAGHGRCLSVSFALYQR
jgi:hypothetical protein